MDDIYGTVYVGRRCCPGKYAVVVSEKALLGIEMVKFYTLDGQNALLPSIFKDRALLSRDSSGRWRTVLNFRFCDMH